MNVVYVLQVDLKFWPPGESSGEWTRKRRIRINYSRPLASSTLREQSSIKIIIKDGNNGIETRIKEMRGLASNTYRYMFNFKLFFPQTWGLVGEPFPSPARQRKWIKELWITWYQEKNESCRYSAIMIEITSGGYQPCPPTSQGIYVSSPWLLLVRCQVQWLAEESETCAHA